MLNALTPPARLAAHEQGARLHPIDRAIVLLRLATDDPSEDLASLPIGVRDRRLLDHRRATFGDRIPCLIDCPACAATQEFELSAAALADGLAEAPEGEATLELDGWRVSLRPLASRDLAWASQARDANDAASVLLERAVATVQGPGGQDKGDLPPPLWNAIEAEVSAREAAAEISLDFTCADCAASWMAAFDIAACFWSEVDADARRLLAEVAALAERFGWSETEILGLSSARRRAYLELAGAG
ncbi:hypothetical protein QFZ27_001916 [Inquilinus ginsengisoli]|uniref:hypothetical protein n=1 Tax=Inquilinus ginsengisoli TaxID=363840 RepID=UPI003D1B1E2D